MGNKINANALRLGLNKTWKSRWFARGQNYTDKFHQDLAIRKRVQDSLQAAGLDQVVIKRSAEKIEVEAYVARPGVAIGRGGEGIEQLNAELKKLFGAGLEVKISEVKKPDLSAPILAYDISTGILRRMPPKLLAMNAISKARAAGAKGIRIWISGRINGVQQARTIKHFEGAVPLHTLKADIDFAEQTAETNDLGIFGIKVWIYKGESDNFLDETTE